MRYIGDKKKLLAAGDDIDPKRALRELRDVHGKSKRAAGAPKKTKKPYRIDK